MFIYIIIINDFQSWSTVSGPSYKVNCTELSQTKPIIYLFLSNTMPDQVLKRITHTWRIRKKRILRGTRDGGRDRRGSKTKRKKKNTCIIFFFFFHRVKCPMGILFLFSIWKSSFYFLFLLVWNLFAFNYVVTRLLWGNKHKTMTKCNKTIPTLKLSFFSIRNSDQLHKEISCTRYISNSTR